MGACASDPEESELNREAAAKKAELCAEACCEFGLNEVHMSALHPV